METKREGSVVMWDLVSAMLSQNLVIIPVLCSSSMEDQKNYFPDPRAGTPPSGSHGTSPSHSVRYGTPPLHAGSSHVGGSTNCNCCGGTPPIDGHYQTPTLTPLTFGSSPITFTPPTAPIVIPGVSLIHNRKKQN